MTPHQQTLLQEIETDLAATDPQVQLGLGRHGTPTFDDATAALTKTLSFLSQLPIDDAHREDLIRQTQAAYQGFLSRQTTGSAGATAQKSPPTGKRTATTPPPSVPRQPQTLAANSLQHYLRQFSALKTLTSVIVAFGMGFWAASRYVSKPIDAYEVDVSSVCFVALVSFVVAWFTVSLFELASSESKSLPTSKVGWSLVGVLATLVVVVAGYQAWTSFSYLELVRGAPSDGSMRVGNFGEYESTSTAGIMFFVLFLLNIALCVIVDNALKLGGVSPARRVGAFLGLFIGAPFLLLQFNGIIGIDSPRVKSSLIGMAPFFVAPLLLAWWASKKNIIVDPLKWLVQCLSAIAFVTMLVSYTTNPYNVYRTVESRLPDPQRLDDKQFGEFLFYMSTYNVLGERTPENESEMDKALRTFISRSTNEQVERGIESRWPKKDAYGYNASNYRASAIAILREQGFLPPAP